MSLVDEIVMLQLFCLAYGLAIIIDVIYVAWRNEKRSKAIHYQVQKQMQGIVELAMRGRR